ncbi:MAG: hypothetical protein BMS9Abin37_0440 [Acidobacteriota bacterium]|nr:MAG: hypothetical protein BMS9Abin37_0440 [Acidobacteriota bacterium]
MSTEAGTLARPWVLSEERDSRFVYGIAFWLALIQVSIAASEIVLAVLVCVWLYRAFQGALTVYPLPVDRPIALYAGSSLLAALFSFDPAFSLHASKKLLLLVVPFMLVSTVRRSSSVETLVLVLIVMADIGALVGLWQYQFGDLGDLNHRIRGFMSHYMTYSGLLMGVGILAFAQLLFRDRYRAFLISSLGVITLALLLSLTRNAWLGMAVGAVTLAFLRDKRLLLLVPLITVAMALVLPRDVERRLGSFLSPDSSGVDRVYMLQAGMGMVANHPWLGVGPNMVAEVYPIYVARDAPRRDNPHLHNNMMQIAAERGLPCLAAWLWILGVAFISSGRAFRRAANDSRGRALAAGSLGVLIAGFLAGTFEYNFGDSEFQMLFLFAMTIPWILDREVERDNAEAST